ncbi:MAG: hypothetical protein HW421_2191 [Ignavibacteria bacterium]|nr:hypothetical protein [Ignavibacteria bacterium]
MYLLIRLCLLFFIFINYNKCLCNTDSFIIPFSTFSAEFERESLENGSLLKTKGSVYFSATSVYIEVSEPLKQIVKIDSNLMVLYYPDEKKGLKISSEVPFTIPIISPFLSALRPDFGLQFLGFSMKDYQLIGDTLLTKWEPIKMDSELHEKFTLKTIKNRLISVVIQDKETERTIKKMLFDNHILIEKESWIPRSVTIYDGENNINYIEKIILYKQMFNKIIPDSIQNFKIPDGTDIQESKW